MKVLIVPGYGDVTGYIERLTKRWPKKYGLEPYIHAFGTTDPADTYDQHWQEFEEVLARLAPVAIIGISFGFSIASRAIIEHPDKVPKIISICGAHDLQAIDNDLIDKKYQMIRLALNAFDPAALPAHRIMTFSPWYDRIVNPQRVIVEGAVNRRIPILGHNAGLATALALQSCQMANFLLEAA